MAKLILLVDDEPDTIKLLTLRLKKNGYLVIPCQTGREALDAVKLETPDLAILDLKLPDMTGYDLLNCFRHNPTLKEMPIIFSTADANVAVKKTIREYHADAFVIKPYDAQDLLRKIENLLLAA